MVEEVQIRVDRGSRLIAYLPKVEFRYVKTKVTDHQILPVTFYVFLSQTSSRSEQTLMLFRVDQGGDKW